MPHRSDSSSRRRVRLDCITAIARPDDQGADDALVLYAVARRHGIGFDGEFHAELAEGDIERDDDGKRELDEERMADWRCTADWLSFQTGLENRSVRRALERLVARRLVHAERAGNGAAWRADRQHLRDRFADAHVERGGRFVVTGQLDYTTAILDAVLSPNARRVAAYVWRRCATGPTWLGIDFLCADLGMSDRTARRAVADAHAAGLITKELRHANTRAPRREQWLGRPAARMPASVTRNAPVTLGKLTGRSRQTDRTYSAERPDLTGKLTGNSERRPLRENLREGADERPAAAGPRVPPDADWPWPCPVEKAQAFIERKRAEIADSGKDRRRQIIVCRQIQAASHLIRSLTRATHTGTAWAVGWGPNGSANAGGAA